MDLSCSSGERHAGVLEAVCSSPVSLSWSVPPDQYLDWKRSVGNLPLSQRPMKDWLGSDGKNGR